MPAFTGDLDIGLEGGLAECASKTFQWPNHLVTARPGFAGITGSLTT
jgi:hypothetical protein